jgi:zinc transport system ATP-binding protein
MDKYLINFQNVSLGYGKKTILSNLNFGIIRNDFLGIVGPNGAGKSTILKAILGILKPRTGNISFYNQSKEKLKIGYVPQRGTLDEIYPLTVLDVILMGQYRRIGYFRNIRKAHEEHALDALEHLGIIHLAQNLFSDLSGGQKQRALIARAIVSEPNILILDEPTDGLDLESQNAIMDLVKHFHFEHKIAILLVSHHLNLVINYAHRIALLERGTFQIGEIDDILTVENLRQIYNMPLNIKVIDGEKVIIHG